MERLLLIYCHSQNLGQVKEVFQPRQDNRDTAGLYELSFTALTPTLRASMFHETLFSTPFEVSL